MSRAKYQLYLQQMYQDNQELFTGFREIHDLYATDKRKWQEKYNELGKPILRIIEECESKLCSQMESGNNAAYSDRLAEKFRAAVKKDFPYIEFIGVIRK